MQGEDDTNQGTKRSRASESPPPRKRRFFSGESLSTMARASTSAATVEPSSEASGHSAVADSTHHGPVDPSQGFRNTAGDPLSAPLSRAARPASESPPIIRDFEDEGTRHLFSRRERSLPREETDMSCEDCGAELSEAQGWLCLDCAWSSCDWGGSQAWKEADEENGVRPGDDDKGSEASTAERGDGA